MLRASEWRAGLAKIQEEICMSLRKAGWLLSAAAAFFWLSWALMPGVGVTAAAQIFDLVSKQRPYIMLSVVAQLLSAAL